jgi:hypothetical protein
MTLRALGKSPINKRVSECTTGKVNHPSEPSSWTLSHKLRFISQFSLVRVSSVALTLGMMWVK